MDTVKYKDIQDYLSVLNHYKYMKGEFCLFRGQLCDKPLLPKIARKNPAKDTAKTERSMLEELRRRGTLLIDGKITDDWNLLVYAQHFGMATRLLDWTSSPLAALWFACCDADPGFSGYVYLLEVSRDLLLNPSTEIDPFSIGKTRILKPHLNNPRIIAQGGWFTAHCYSKKDHRFVPLENNSDIKRHLVQIEIAGRDKSTTLKHLDVLGINSQSLFPDVEGLCTHINWMHDLIIPRRRVY